MGEDHNRHMKELQEFLRVGVTIFLVEVNLLGIVENLKDVWRAMYKSYNKFPKLLSNLDKLKKFWGWFGGILEI